MDRRASGTLEAEVLTVLWASPEPVSAEEVRRRLDGDLAHTTVSTILSRLHRKGAVTRQLVSRGYVYSPVLDEAGMVASRMRALLEDQRDRAGVLSQFVAGLDRRALDSLRRALERGRQS
jgi:predicted transcriptional regulator